MAQLTCSVAFFAKPGTGNRRMRSTARPPAAMDPENMGNRRCQDDLSEPHYYEPRPRSLRWGMWGDAGPTPKRRHAAGWTVTLMPHKNQRGNTHKRKETQEYPSSPVKGFDELYRGFRNKIKVPHDRSPSR